MNQLILIFCLSFIWINSVSFVQALNPDRELTNYVIRAWQTEEGLPQNYVSTIARYDNEYLWFGTLEGLVRFDGVQFKVFNKFNTPGISDSFISCLEPLSNGIIAVGTEKGGLLIYSNGVFQSFGINSAPGSLYIRSLEHDMRGNLWIGTGFGLYKMELNKAHFTKIDNPLVSSSNISALFCDSGGTLWIGANGRLLKMTGEDITVFADTNVLGNGQVTSICMDKQGFIWAGTEGNGLFMFSYSGDMRHFGGGKDLPSAIIRTVYCDKNGVIWTGTASGIARFNGKRFDYAEGDGVFAVDVFCILEDAENSLWVGTAAGLFQLRDGKVQVISTKHGLAHNLVFCTFEDSRGRLWLGLAGAGINVLDNNKVAHFPPIPGVLGGYVFAFSEMTNGTILVGSNEGIAEFKNGLFGKPPWASRIPSNDDVRAILVDSKKRIWIGTKHNGLFCLQNGLFNNYTKTNGLADNTVRVIVEDRYNNIWVGTDNGLTQISDSVLKNYSTNHGLPSVSIKSISVQDQNILWIGTDHGMAIYRRNKFYSIFPKDGLYGDSIFQILDDYSGFLWLSSSRGIYRVSKNNILSFTDGSETYVHSLALGKIHGFTVSECVGGSQPAGVRLRGGQLCYPSVYGVLILDPRDYIPNKNPPRVVIEEASVDNTPIKLNTNNRIKPDSGEITVRYTALCLASPENVKFKYKLEGVNKDWVYAGNVRMVRYNFLKPGQYVFKVTACNSDGYWNPQPVELGFEILPRFYQTVWFYMLLLVIFGVLSYLFYLHRINRMKAHERTLQLLVDLRTRRLKKEVDKVRKLQAALLEAKKLESIGRLAAGVAHHFNNILTVILGHGSLLKKQVENNPEALENVDRLIKATNQAADITRSLLAFSQKMLFRPKIIDPIAFLQENMHRLQMLLGNKIVIRFVYSNVIPNIYADPEMLQLVLINLANNSKDAMPQGGEFSIELTQAKAKQVDQFSETEKDGLLIKVSDNGVGMSVEVLEKVFEPFFTTKDIGQGAGLGLATVYGIVKQHNGHISITSTKGVGTTVSIWIPAASSEQ